MEVGYQFVSSFPVVPNLGISFTLGADGLKTGHTEAAGYGLTASVKRGERRIIMVVNGLPSMKARAQELVALDEQMKAMREHIPLVEWERQTRAAFRLDRPKRRS